MDSSPVLTSHNQATEYPVSSTIQHPSSIDHFSKHYPAPAGQTPPVLHNTTHSVSPHGLVPSPAECTSPTTGTLFHPATPLPTTSSFHNTPASPNPTFAVNILPSSSPFYDTTSTRAANDSYENSPVLCGPTPASTPVHPNYSHSNMAHSPQPSPMEFASETPQPTPAPHLLTIKGNITSFVGKVTNNPDKQQAGNAMIANRKEEKAAFFDQKATEWELKGNTNKAQKNREKASKCRRSAQAKLNATPTSTNKTSAKMEKAAQLDLKAYEYERNGDRDGAARTHNKARNLRAKYALGQPAGVGPASSPFVMHTVPPAI